MTQYILAAGVLLLQLALNVCGQAPGSAAAAQAPAGMVMLLAPDPLAPPVFGAINPSAQGAPTLTSATPATGAQAVGTAVTFVGANLLGTTSINGGAGFTGTLVSVTPTMIVAVVALDSNAALGPRNVTVTTPYGTSNALSFTVTSSTGPTLTSSAPAAGVQNSVVNVTLTGTNLTGALSIGHSNVGITTSNLAVVNATTVTATFTVANTAPTGIENVTITTGVGTSPAAAIFTVNAPAYPTITSVSPSSGVQGNAYNVTITGTNLTGTTAIAHSAAGVTTGALVVVNSTTVTTTFTIAFGATVGVDSLMATTPVGNSVQAPVFTVVAASLPTLTSVSPNNALQGSTTAVTLTGTNLIGSNTVTHSNAGLSTTGLSVTNSTTVAATFTATLAAATGAETFTISTPVGTSNPITYTINPALVTSVTTEPTNTQVIFRMPAAPATCTVEVSPSVTYLPLVPDVDPALFTGAGTYTQNAGHWYVVGKRQLATTLGAAVVSRALQLATLYYYRVSCPSTTAVTGTFTTQTLQPTTYLEPAAGSPLGNPINRDETLVDPLTGTAIKKLALPGDRVGTVNNTSLQVTFPFTLTTTKQFLPADSTTVFVGNFAFLKQDPAANQYSLHYFQVNAAYAANPATISACLTYDGVSCAAGGKTLASTPGASAATFGTTAIGDMWQAAGAPMPGGYLAAKQGSPPVPTFGVLMWVNANTVALTSATYNYQLGTRQAFPYGGALDQCSATSVIGVEGTAGYNCYLDSFGTMYWTDAVSAKTHVIGRYMTSSADSTSGGCGSADGIIFDPVNPDKWYCGGNPNVTSNQHLWSFTYHGNHSEPPESYEEGTALPLCNAGISNQPCVVGVDLTAGTDLGTLAHAFDANFQNDRFRDWYLVGVEDGKLLFRVWRSGQHSLGWTVVYDPAVPGVVAALSSWRSPGFRWCGQKSNEPVNTPGWLSVGPYPLAYAGETGPGHGPYVVNATGAATAATCPTGFSGTCVTIPVDGEPYDLFPCTASAASCFGAVESSTKGELQNAAVNDEFTLDGTGSNTAERLILAAKTDATHWIFERAYNGVTSTLTGTNQLWTACNTNPLGTNLNSGGGSFWNYAVDPHAAAALSRDPYSINAHFFNQNLTAASSYTVDARCTPNSFGRSCYQVRTWTSIPNYIATVPQGILTLSPTFAAKFGLADGNQIQSHPAGAGLAATTAQKAFFFDARPYNGASGNTGAVNVSGNLWKYTASNAPLDRKYMPTFAYAGAHQLTDISGPALNGTMTTPYTYCVALLANECAAGSSPGDVYMVAAAVNHANCFTAGQATGLAYTDIDLCVGNNSMTYNSIMQLPVSTVEMTGAGFRALSHGFVTPRTQAVFDNVHPLPSGNWLLYDISGFNGGAYDQIAWVQVPPQPAADAVNRTTYITTPVTVPTLAGADNATVSFGYAEYGGFCTSRAEECQTGVAAALPFYFATSEAASLTGVACTTGCTVNVPALSQRVLLGHIVYRTGTAFFANGPAFAVVTP